MLFEDAEIVEEYAAYEALCRLPGPEFYATDAWRRLRYDVIERSSGHCECCGNRRSPGNPIQVDHIQPRYWHPELSLDPDNLQCLCRDCNLGKGARYATDWRYL